MTCRPESIVGPRQQEHGARDVLDMRRRSRERVGRRRRQIGQVSRRIVLVGNPGVIHRDLREAASAEEPKINKVFARAPTGS
jgi:hypothetical protein